MREPNNREMGLQELDSILTLACNETQLVWQRYNVMLAANALLLATLGAIVGKSIEDYIKRIGDCAAVFQPIPWMAVLVLGSIAGIALSRVWWNLTRFGWELVEIWGASARRYRWLVLENPFHQYLAWAESRRGFGVFWNRGQASSRAPYTGWNDAIAKLAKVVMLTFGLIYGSLLLAGAGQMLCTWQGKFCLFSAQCKKSNSAADTSTNTQTTPTSSVSI